MREIKFRGKSTNTGKFVYGYFGYDWDYKSDLKPMIQSEPQMNGTSFSRTIIDTSTLGQFTGLKDKNGIDVYEGDIIALADVVCAITFEDGSFQMITDKQQGRSNAIQERLKRFEVIGNIYENKNLI